MTTILHLGRALFAIMLLSGSSGALASPPGRAAPAFFGAPLEFILFGLTLVGIALFHKRALAVSLSGLAAIVAYEAFVSGFPTGEGMAALGRHLGHEWVTF